MSQWPRLIMPGVSITESATGENLPCKIASPEGRAAL
jgi:hypothetical protein